MAGDLNEQQFRGTMYHPPAAGADTDPTGWEPGDIVKEPDHTVVFRNGQAQVNEGRRMRVTGGNKVNDGRHIYVADEDDTEPYPQSNRSVRVYKQGHAGYSADPAHAFERVKKHSDG